MKFDEFKQKAIAALVDCPLKASEIAQATGANISSVYSWLKKLVISGDIVKGEDGVFRLATNEELSEAFIETAIAQCEAVEVEVIEERMPRASMSTQLEMSIATKAKKQDTGTVGTSDRTYGKHKLLNRMLGRLTGASVKLRFLKPPFIYIDLCAGDGKPSYFSGYSSPEIIQKHANYLRKMRGDNAAIVILVEQDPATFDRLKQSPHAQHKNDYLIQGNSKSPDVIAQIKEIISEHCTPYSPCFIHNDPNKVSDFAITGELLKLLPRYTTSLSTMGCNVSGLKRLPLSDRQGWFSNVDLLIDAVNSVKCHDAHLVSLHQDKAQWAYLVTNPRKWNDEICQDVEKAFGYWTKGLDSAWLSSPDQFNNLVRTLFLTKKELEGGQDVA